MEDEDDWPRGNNSFAFLNRDELVRLYAWDGVFLAARPNNVYADGFTRFGLAQAKGQWQFTLRQIAGPGFNHAKETEALFGFHRYFRADPVPVRSRADRLHA